MTTGIYRLEFENRQVYIGKSEDIHKRYSQHLNKLVQGKHTANMQKVYIGIKPILTILQVCDISWLDLLEKFWYFQHTTKARGKYVQHNYQLLNTIKLTDLESKRLRSPDFFDKLDFTKHILTYIN